MELSGILGLLAPRTVGRYLVNRRYLADCQRLYEAAQPDNYRPIRGSGASGDSAVGYAGARLRDMARHLDENHDLAVAVLDDLINNTVGDGVVIAPMVRDTAGKLDRAFNDQLRELFDAWADQPDVTGTYGFVALERLAARTLYRDGEVFAQLVTGNQYQYRTKVPFALEMLEPDFCPLDLYDSATNTTQGIQLDQWRRPVAFHFYKHHPGNLTGSGLNIAHDTKRISADRVIHERFTRRLHQLRGVSVLHAALNRLRDVMDYEQSERIAAKVASDMTGFIRRTGEYAGPAVDANKNRPNHMQAGQIYELMPGEDVGTIAHNRPNTELSRFRNAMLRAVAGGTGTRYSSISRNYQEGNYSSQRQELVEGVVAYRSLFKQRVRAFYRPLWSMFVDQAFLSGALKLPRGLDVATLRRADFRAPALPWIDPQKEANAWKILLDAGLESHAEIQRQRGRDPAKVQEEIEQEREAGLFAGDLTEVEIVEDEADDDKRMRVNA